MPAPKSTPKRKPSTRKPPAARRKKKRNTTSGPFWMIIILLGIFALVFHFSDLIRPAPALADDEIRVSFIDVKQGESILIQSKEHAVLIDGGEYSTRQTVVNYLHASGIKSLDYLVATHPHSDHIGGLPAVIQELNVKHVLMPDSANNTAAFENLLNAIEDNNIPITVPSPGDRFSAGLIMFTALAPVRAYDDFNNNSLVLRLLHGQNTFLFTGDAEQASERDMIASGSNLSAQVLSAGHHGSSTSSSDAFLDAVNPQILVISCGRGNSYGHPSNELLENLKQRNIANVLRTDELGTIVLSTNGQQVSLLTNQ